MSIGTPVEGSPGGASSTTLTIAVPSSGSVIIVHTDGTAAATGVSSSINGAFTQAQLSSSPAGSGLYPAIWYLNAASSGSHTVTITAAGATIYYVMGFYVTGSSFDVSAQFGNSFGGTGTDLLLGGSVTTAGADTVFTMQIAVSLGALATAGTTPNAFTSISLPTGNPNKNFLSYYQQSAAGTINPTSGSTVNGYYQGFTFALTPSAILYKSSGGAGNGTAASFTITIAGVTTGDAILVCVIAASSTPPSGVSDADGAYTQLGTTQYDASNGYGMALFGRVATSTGTHTVSVPLPGSINSYYMYYTANGNGSIPFDGTGGAYGPPNTNPLSCNFSTTKVNDLVPSFVVCWNGSAVSGQSGTARSVGSLGSGFYMQDQAFVGPGSVTPSFSFTTSGYGTIVSTAISSNSSSGGGGSNSNFFTLLRRW